MKTARYEYFNADFELLFQHRIIRCSSDSVMQEKRDSNEMQITDVSHIK